MRGWQDFLGTKKLIIRNKIKGLGHGFRNNKKIVQELGTKLKDSDRDLGTMKRLFRNKEQK